MTTKLPLAQTGRACGDCQACCTSFETVIDGALKPKHVKCPHQCPKGCAIYQDRPDPCRAFRCLWLDGAAEEEDRPDLSGVMPILYPLFGAGEKMVPAVTLEEVRPGALSSPRGARLLERARERWGIVVGVFYDGARKVYTPSAHVARQLAQMLGGQVKGQID